ncbi:MAG: ATP-dependent Clp protease ATP-binding subunit ClpA, partial [Desulfobacterales bacterium]|nr:ATP-dependent Clp protease ATP-binding subunit ClpA [Desulfobacterales bacterium]
MISKELSATLGQSVKEAQRRRHEYVSIEHVLYAILNDNIGVDIIENCGGDIDKIKEGLEKFFQERMISIPRTEEYVLQQTLGFQR